MPEQTDSQELKKKNFSYKYILRYLQTAVISTFPKNTSILLYLQNARRCQIGHSLAQFSTNWHTSANVTTGAWYIGTYITLAQGIEKPPRESQYLGYLTSR